MKSKIAFKIGFLSIIIFILIAAYFWFLYFHNGLGKEIKENKGIELINSGNINYVNAGINDPKSIIPVYYFRVKNNLENEFNYAIYLNEVRPSSVNDGCTKETIFSKKELDYELTLDSKIIKKGTLSDLSGNYLNITKVPGKSIHDYSLRIWLNNKATDIDSKHYHFIVELEEK